MLRRFVLLPLARVIVANPEVFVFIFSTAVMAGMGIVLRLYGLEAFLVVTAVIVILGFWIDRHRPLTFDYGPPDDPAALTHDTPPPLPGPGTHAPRLRSIGAKLIPTSPSSTFQAVSGQRDNGGRPAPSALLSRPD